MITISIPTKNRPMSLIRLLSGLISQDLEDCNIRILDNSPTENVSRYSTDFPELLHCLDVLRTLTEVQVDLAPDNSLIECRQILLEKSDEYCLFIDDDVVLSRDCISKLVMFYQNIMWDIPPAFVCPRIVEIKNYLDVPEWVREFPKDEVPAKHPYGEYTEKTMVELTTMDTACAMVNKKQAIKIGGFIDIPYPLEHVYLSRRLKDGGFTGYLIPRATVWHMPTKENRNPLHEGVFKAQMEMTQ